MARIRIETLARPEEQDLTTSESRKVVGAGPGIYGAYYSYGNSYGGYGYGMGQPITAVATPFGSIVTPYSGFRTFGPSVNVVGGGYYAPFGVTRFGY